MPGKYRHMHECRTQDDLAQNKETGRPLYHTNDKTRINTVGEMITHEETRGAGCRDT